MFEAHVLSYFWPEAISSTTYLTNRLPTKTLKFKTPLEALRAHTTVPSFHSLPPRIFGCVVYVHLPKTARNKLEPRAIKCIFVVYCVNQKGYRCFDPTQNKLYTTMNCEFFEHSYFYSQLRPQGETTCDELSWLTHSVTNDLNPKEQVGNPTDIATENIVLLSFQAFPTLSEASSNQEVVCEPQEVLFEPESQIDDDISGIVNSPCRYELPPRSKRGVPQRRYDPKFKS